jgi:hypothetical protein
MSVGISNVRVGLALSEAEGSDILVRQKSRDTLMLSGCADAAVESPEGNPGTTQMRLHKLSRTNHVGADALVRPSQRCALPNLKRLTMPTAWTEIG